MYGLLVITAPNSWNLILPRFQIWNDRPVAGGGAGEAQAPPPPEIFRLELNSATKVEFLY